MSFTLKFHFNGGDSLQITEEKEDKTLEEYVSMCVELLTSQNIVQLKFDEGNVAIIRPSQLNYILIKEEDSLEE